LGEFVIAPRALGGGDLVLSHFTLARTHPLDDRIAAAAAAGFAGIGLFAGEFMRLRADGFTIAALRDMLDRYDVCLAEIEVLSGWGAEHQAGAYREFEAVVWDLVDAFECRYVQAIGPHDGTIDDAAQRFAGVCDRAAEHGAVVGLEFLPFTNIVDARDALAIVERANRPNGGVCVDIWHHARGAGDLDLIRAIPVERILGVQMSDGPATPTLPDYKDDCLRHRVPPGDGEFGAVDFVRTLIELGVDVPWSLEVCNDDVWGRPGADHVRRAADAMRTILTQLSHRAGPNVTVPATAAPTCDVRPGTV
jgi:sugar phosphate isomerase/epimerase